MKKTSISLSFLTFTFRQGASGFRPQSMGKLDTQLVAMDAGGFWSFDEIHRSWVETWGYTFEEMVPGPSLQNLRREGTSWTRFLQSVINQTKGNLLLYSKERMWLAAGLTDPTVWAPDPRSSYCCRAFFSFSSFWKRFTFTTNVLYNIPFNQMKSVSDVFLGLIGHDLQVTLPAGHPGVSILHIEGRSLPLKNSNLQQIV